MFEAIISDEIVEEVMFFICLMVVAGRCREVSRDALALVACACAKKYIRCASCFELLVEEGMKIYEDSS